MEYLQEKIMTDEQLSKLGYYIQQINGDRTSPYTPGGQQPSSRTENKRPPNVIQRRYNQSIEEYSKVKVISQDDNFSYWVSVFSNTASKLYAETGCRNLIDLLKSHPVSGPLWLGTSILFAPYLGAAIGAVIIYILS